jgi:hypothetical protein
MRMRLVLVLLRQMLISPPGERGSWAWIPGGVPVAGSTSGAPGGWVDLLRPASCQAAKVASYSGQTGCHS